ncbi:MAG: hypothetical protein WC809_09460 [Sinimarinibacterium sp.]
MLKRALLLALIVGVIAAFFGVAWGTVLVSFASTLSSICHTTGCSTRTRRHGGYSTPASG